MFRLLSVFLVSKGSECWVFQAAFQKFQRLSVDSWGESGCSKTVTWSSLMSWDLFTKMRLTTGPMWITRLCSWSNVQSWSLVNIFVCLFKWVVSLCRSIPFVFRIQVWVCSKTVGGLSAYVRWLCPHGIPSFSEPLLQSPESTCFNYFSYRFAGWFRRPSPTRRTWSADLCELSSQAGIRFKPLEEVLHCS